MSTPNPADELDQQPNGTPAAEEGSVVNEDGEQDTKPEHPIAQAINTFLHHARDIEDSAQVFIPLAVKIRKKEFDTLKTELSEDLELLSKDQAIQAGKISNVLDNVRRIERLRESRVPQVLESSLFLGMFSAFDAFTGELLTALYSKKPELFKSLNRTIPVSRILQYESFEELKTNTLQDEIEIFRRKSYVEQFEDLENRFGVKLRAFERWPRFVERAQRRNLMTHCNGIVSDQYLKICRQEGYEFSSPVAVGDHLKLGPQYFLSTCELMMEVALKLGQVLWRKLLPAEIAEADSHLKNVVYDCLKMEKWERAQVFGEFSVEQRNVSRDLDRKIATVNYAIALKFGGKLDKAADLLAKVDWTAAINDFKLAEAVLLERYEEATDVMRRIGTEGELVKEEAYHSWPLFNAFRETEQFLEAYRSIYGHPFDVEVQRAADQIQADTSEELQKEEVASSRRDEFDTTQYVDEIEAADDLSNGHTADFLSK